MLATRPPTTIDYSPIERANLQPSTKAKYKRELECMALAGIHPANHAQLQQYATTLKSSRKQFLKSALRLMTADVYQAIKAGAPVDSLDDFLQAQKSLWRIEAMDNAITVETHKGQKAHIWLSTSQVVHITAQCPGAIEGKRDWIVLGLLLGAGLRREELAGLTFDALKQQPTKSGQPRDILEVTGKGAKSRVIPISQKLGDRLREWKQIVGGGYVARAMKRNGELTDSMSDRAIFELVNKYGAMIGVPDLAPHDCRRSFAHLGYEAGVPITQIKELLGHASVATTQKYLDLSLNIETTASDFIPLS